MKAVFVLLVCAVAVYGQDEKPEPYMLPQAYPVFPEDAWIDETRIVNGQAATANQIPYQVTIFHNNLPTPTGGGGICGGSLISPIWVFTAAHCTINFSWHHCGVGSINRLAQQQSRSSNFVINHAQYNPSNLNNDVSLVRFDNPVTLSVAVATIRVPNASEQGNLWVGSQAMASGFGRTTNTGAVSNVLMWTWIRIITNAQCAATYGTSVVVPHVICGLGWDFNSQSTCNGDSGGPLAIRNPGNNLLIGVVSFVSSAGCTSGHPSGYMRAGHFTAWVNANTGLGF